MTPAASSPPVILKIPRAKPYLRAGLISDTTLQPYSVPPIGELLTSRGPTTCDGERRVFDCPDGHERRLVYVGCGKRDCELCAGSVSTKRAREIWPKIAKVRAPWGIFILTFPDFLLPRIDPRALDKLRKSAWRLIELWLAHVNGIELGWAKEADADGWTFGGMEFTHPTGERYQCRACSWSMDGSASAERQAQRHEQDNDAHEVEKRVGDTWKPHLNFIIPMRSSAGAQGLKFYWKDQAEFERVFRILRRAWRRELSRHFGPIEGEVNLHYEFRAEIEKKRHALRYFARVFPGWSHAKLRARSFGYLSDRCLREAAWEWEIPEPFWSRPVMTCSTCGKKLVDSGVTDRASAEEILRAQRAERREKRLAG